jgi:hypothetical protein
MENRFNPYECDGDNIQMGRQSQEWQFVETDSLDMNQNVFGYAQDNVQHQNENLEDPFVQMANPVVQTRNPKPRRGGKVKKVSQRGKGFTKEEDSFICSAFLNTTKDPITGILI